MMRFLSFILAMVLVSSSAIVFADPVPTTAPTIDLASGNSISTADAVDTQREGTHFVGRLAHLAHIPNSSQCMLIFDTDGSTKSESMIVQQNLNLVAMENVIKTADVQFRISGTVTEYKGKNFILVDHAETTLAPATQESPDAPAPAVEAAPKLSKPESPAQLPSLPTIRGESAEQKMDRLLAPPPDAGRQLPSRYDINLASNATTGNVAVAPEAPALKLVREGTHLIDRIGRLNHSIDGNQATLTFDADGKAMADPPMIILPNLKLGMMESAVLGRAGDLHFRVSGTVTEYKGHNYILLDKAVAIADVETQF
jgi:hypothetical protein